MAKRIILMSANHGIGLTFAKIGMVSYESNNKMGFEITK
jgi:hypothetical protein